MQAGSLTVKVLRLVRLRSRVRWCVCGWSHIWGSPPCMHGEACMLYITVLELVPRDLFVGVVQDDPAVPHV